MSRAEYVEVETLGGTEVVLKGYEAGEATKVAAAMLYGTAPDPRPTATADCAAPLETGPSHQIEHQIVRVERICKIVMPQGCEQVQVLDKASGEVIADFHRTPGVVGDELLTKVLPAGEPLLAAHWTCPICGLSVRGVPPRSCLSEPGTTGCPAEAYARGRQIGHGPCPSCEHVPGDPRDNPFKSCRACGYHP